MDNTKEQEQQEKNIEQKINELDNRLATQITVNANRGGLKYLKVITVVTFVVVLAIALMSVFGVESKIEIEEPMENSPENEGYFVPPAPEEFVRKSGRISKPLSTIDYMSKDIYRFTDPSAKIYYVFSDKNNLDIALNLDVEIDATDTRKTKDGYSILEVTKIHF